MLTLDKKCSKCGKLLPSTMFHRDGTKLLNHCRDCEAKRKAANAASRNKTSAQRIKKKKEVFNTITKHSIYFVASSFKPEHVKIGHTSNLYHRVSSFLNATSGDLLLLALLEVESYRDELIYHREFENLRIANTEWFVAKSSLIRFLSSLDQAVARKSLITLTTGQQSRIIIPNIEHWISSLPFLG